MRVHEVHILSACMTQFKMKSLDDIPSIDIYPKNVVPYDSMKRREHLLSRGIEFLGTRLLRRCNLHCSEVRTFVDFNKRCCGQSLSHIK